MPSHLPLKFQGSLSTEREFPTVKTIFLQIIS